MMYVLRFPDMYTTDILPFQKCTTLTVADAVDGDKATTLPSVSPPCHFLHNVIFMIFIFFQDTKDVMEKLDKGKQRVLEEDNEESLDYDIRHVDDTFANYRASSPALARNESRTVLVEKEKETVTPTENEMSSVRSLAPHVIYSVNLPHRHPQSRLSSMQLSKTTMKRRTMNSLL